MYRLPSLLAYLALPLLLGSALPLTGSPSTISFQKPTVTAPENLRKPIPLKLLRGSPGAAAVTVRYAVVPGTASSPDDLEAGAGEVQFAAMEKSKVIPIMVKDDTVVEGDETFLVRLTEIVGDAVAGPITEVVVTIREDDRAGTVSFGAARFVGKEASPTIEIQVLRTGGKAGPLYVECATADGTAVEWQDYEPFSGTLVFEPGETRKVLSIPCYDDEVYRGNRAFQVSLFEPYGGLTLGRRSVATVEIQDDDPKPSSGGGDGGAKGSLIGSKTCTSYSWRVTNEDFSNVSRRSHYEYTLLGQVSREYGTLVCLNTGRTYSFDARFQWNGLGCIASVSLTVSGGVLNPTTQTILF